MSGSREIYTDRLVLRPHVMEDAPVLHELFGIDEEMFAYTGWNPFETVASAEEMLKEVLAGYEEDDHTYGWAITKDGKSLASSTPTTTTTTCAPRSLASASRRITGARATAPKP